MLLKAYTEQRDYSDLDEMRPTVSGHRGRSLFEIKEEQLVLLLKDGFKVQEIAKLLRVST